MPKPKAPAWLTESFVRGVEEAAFFADRHARRTCWLAERDPRRRPCSGLLERFHFIGRQQVENALGALLLGAEVEEWWNDWNGEEGGAGTDRFVMPQDWREELILLAAWDPRNGGLGCEHHHRRLDSHATPALAVPRSALPAHVEEFAADWGLESELERRFR